MVECPKLESIRSKHTSLTSILDEFCSFCFKQERESELIKVCKSCIEERSKEIKSEIENKMVDRIDHTLCRRELNSMQFEFKKYAKEAKYLLEKNTEELRAQAEIIDF
ncbi:hypothetical protein O9G_001338 [Rozella allomycis CSF55]|uniref:Uncharacterized protein n=1 Tax=Rozella allomycis (strain CSF55) TaxID=988480 RepID=A0A075AQB3_ROZAC|nr:hypothetical protein O9G_001338 [Rozella allomycis CSF55]|eukprot:EPZ32436.1 hypothetical protein O9G_001338 [Rozella allomycis CSF55]